MLIGRIAEIEHNLKKQIDCGKLRDDKSGQQYSFNAPLDRFKNNEKVIFQLAGKGKKKVAVIKQKA